MSYISEYRYNTVATLGGFCSCSQAVARKSKVAKEVHGYSSFEEAAEDVRQNKRDALLVPSAYPRLHAFMMDDLLIACDCFIAPIPALVLTCAIVPLPERVDVLFHHPATQTLLPKITPFAFDSAIQAASNELAVESMLVCDRPAAAVTNALVTDNKRLPILQELRPSKPMGWILFIRT